MMFDRYDDDAQRCLVVARQRAVTYGHDHIGTEHLLLAVLEVEDSGGEDGDRGGLGLIESFGVTRAQVEAAVSELLPPAGEPVARQLPFSAEAKEAIEASARETRETIGTVEVVLGLLTVRGGVAARVLEHLGVDGDKARRRRRS